MQSKNFLEKDFYKTVEIKGRLKKVLYSDSVAKYTETIIKRSNQNRCCTITFDKLWDELLTYGNIITYQDGKEYIFINDDKIKTLTYDIKTDKMILDVPEYIMRHKVDTKLVQLSLSPTKTLDITNNHSLLKYNNKTKDFDIIKPIECEYLPIINIDDNKELLILGEPIDNLKNIKSLKTSIINKIDYDDYVYDLCIPQTQTFIANFCVVHNTDSIFITIPTKEDASQLAPDDLWNKAIEASNGINDLIIDYTKDVLLPRCNIKPEHNQTFFKTELLMESIMFLDTKKRYAFKLLIKEGNPLKKPKVFYTGIDVIKSNVAKLTQDLLKEIIENIALNAEILPENKRQVLIDTIGKFYTKFNQCVDDLDTSYVGIPGKWARLKNMISGMKLYNHIMNEPVFEPSSSAKFVYIHPVTIGEFKNVNGICLPYEFNTELVKEKFNIFKIKIDRKLHWSKVYNKTCERVVDLLKKS